MAEKYANLFSTSLSASTDDTQTSIDVAAAAPTALHSGQFRIKVGGELMLVTSGQDTTTWTVTRGVESTTAAAHSAGLSVQHYLTAGALGNIVAEGVAAPTQSFYEWSGVSIPNATWTTLTWPTVSVGDEVLDLTDDENPAFLAPDGVYVVTLVARLTGTSAPPTDSWLALNLLSNEDPSLDQLALSAVTPHTGGSNVTAINGSTVTASFVFSGASGHATMTAFVYQNNGAARNMTARATITRLA